MRAVANTIAIGKPYVELTHRDKSLKFIISPLGKANFVDTEEDKFLYINQYWEGLSETKQDNIFQIYTAIDQVLESIGNRDEISKQLPILIEDLLQYHQVDDVLLWMRVSTGIIVPDTVQDAYVHSIDQNYTREKTYVKSEYMELMALAIVLRAMIPVWGSYIDLVRGGDDGIGTEFKEYNAFKLLCNSKVLDSNPMLKLATYVENIVGSNKFNPNNIHKGISSVDFYEWTLASLCVKRLCITSIQGIGPKANMLSALRGYIVRQVDGKDKNGEDSISDKRVTDESGGNSSFNEKTSPLEKNRFKFDISPGEKAEMEHAMSNIRKSALKISNYQLTVEEVEESIRTAQVLNQEKVLAPQINIMRWLFRSVVSPRGMMHMPSPTIITDAIGASEAILWKTGHKYLAVLASAHPVLNEGINKIPTIRVSANNSKMQIPVELSEQIEELYPFSKTIRSKKRDQSDPPRQDNDVVKAINNMADDFLMYTWRATCSESKLMEIFGTNSRRIPITPDIKIMLAKLIIDLGLRNIP